MIDRGQCVRSGFCCKIATCTIGLYRGANSKGCKFLLGDGPGKYSCQLVLEQDPLIMSGVAIGEGCSSTLFNEDRKLAIKNLVSS